MQDTELPEKIEPTSLNFQTDLAEKLAEIAPEIMSDGKLDVTKLREMVNGDAENSPEKFGLFWPGKRAAQALAQIPTTATLIPAPEESVDWESTKNIFIEGDNLEVLKALQNSYRRKVKMIYIDPPYNTGKEFIYPDKFSEGLQGYLEYTGQKNEAGENVESKPETGGRKHSNWLSMMYPRLQLAKSLLTDDGVIFISIDDNEQSNLKLVCDEVFSEENFIDTLMVEMSNTGGMKVAAAKEGKIAKNGEYILVYGKTAKHREARRSPLFDYVPGYDSHFNLYMNKDGSIGKLSEVLASNPVLIEEFNKFGVTPKNNNISVNALVEYFDNSKVISKFIYDNIDNIVRLRDEVPTVPNNLELKANMWTEYKSDKRDEPYFLSIGENSKVVQLVPLKYNYRKTDDFQAKYGRSVIRGDFWKGFWIDMGNVSKEGGIEFKNGKKPKRLIKQLMKWALTYDKDAIVMDFFAGSSTTAHSLMELNAEDNGSRTYIEVQLPEETSARAGSTSSVHPTISNLSIQRIRNSAIQVRDSFKADIAKRLRPLDTGFRVYKLAPSNFVQWDENKAKDDVQQAVLDFAVNKKPNSAPEALLAEIMLQARMPLSAHIEKRDLRSGGWVYVVDGGNLITYVANEQITENQANEIADLSPAKLIVLDSAFNGNNALKINVANICKEKFIKEFKTI